MPSQARRLAPEDRRDLPVSRNRRARAEGSARREGGHVVEMQRRRLLSASVEVAYERGVQALTVATICERAGLSRKTFYSMYEEREEFLLAAFQDVVAQARDAVLQVLAREATWRERVRTGLVGLLELLDREPGIGRLLVVDALGAGAPTLEARREVLARLAAIVDEGRTDTGRGPRAKTDRQLPPLTAEGVVGAVLAVVHARMLHREEAPLVELTNPLMAMIVQPYLGVSAAQKELGRPVPAAASSTPRLPADPFKDLPMRLTYRTARALTAIATAPGASSRQVADAAGITDVGQISKLLNRLKRYGLIEDRGAGPTKGLPRAWSLTPRGEGVLQAIGAN
jgi:AcrR family transcriptional regulator